MKKLVGVTLLDSGKKYNTTAIFDDEKMSYACSFPGQIIKAWNYDLSTERLLVPQAPKPEQGK